MWKYFQTATLTILESSANRAVPLFTTIHVCRSVEPNHIWWWAQFWFAKKTAGMSQYVRRSAGEAYQPQCVLPTVKHSFTVMIYKVHLGSGRWEDSCLWRENECWKIHYSVGGQNAEVRKEPIPRSWLDFSTGQCILSHCKAKTGLLNTK